MRDVIAFIAAHEEIIVLGISLTWALVSAYVAATPSREDDAALQRFAERLSFLVPKNVAGRFSVPGRREWTEKGHGGGSFMMLFALALCLSGCAGRALVAADTARATACIQVESQCVERAERGQITVNEAEACVSFARSTCDAIRERLVSE